MLEIADGDDEFKYFGEFGRKLRVKETGHTMKTRTFRRNGGATTIVRAKQTQNSSTYFSKLQEIAVTEIDDYFDYGFSKGYERRFNTPERWEKLEEMLQEIAVKISKEFNRYEGHCKIHYDIPVIGHMLYPNTYMNTKRQKIEENWIFWNGKYYDPDYIYQYFPYNQSNDGSHSSRCVYSGDERNQMGYLKPVCPLIKGGKDPLTKLGKIDTKHNRIAAVSLTKQNKDYIQLDLGRVCEITHIGTLGAYPTRLRYFPYISDENYWLLRYHGRRRRRRARRSRFVYVIEDETELSWVLRYKIEFRDLHTGKWIQYEASFNGNQDVGTESIHKVSIMTRYLRVTPLDYHNQRRMRLNIYGEGLKRELKEGDIELETIRYTISPPTNKKLFDGYGCGDYCYYSPPESKKITMFKLLQDEVQSSYYRIV